MSMDITKYFSADHDRLDIILEASEKEMVAGNGKALDYFTTFKNGLKKHIDWEEEILFPLFEKKLNIFSMGPTQVMRLEHQKIINILTQIEMVLSQQQSDPDLFMALKTLLQSHNIKEESILYPAIDEKLSKTEIADIFSSMAELPEVDDCGI
ncbi:MAG: hemerythrin domain-containing protein [Porticoccaceae bacterium]|nr:hemerythrin domain-containing protein [Porticoccaceae bacterium]